MSPGLSPASNEGAFVLSLTLLPRESISSIGYDIPTVDKTTRRIIKARKRLTTIPLEEISNLFCHFVVWNNSSSL